MCCTEVGYVSRILSRPRVAARTRWRLNFQRKFRHIRHKGSRRSTHEVAPEKANTRVVGKVIDNKMNLAGFVMNLGNVICRDTNDFAIREVWAVDSCVTLASLLRQSWASFYRSRQSNLFSACSASNHSAKEKKFENSKTLNLPRAGVTRTVVIRSSKCANFVSLSRIPEKSWSPDLLCCRMTTLLSRWYIGWILVEPLLKGRRWPRVCRRWWIIQGSTYRGSPILQWRCHSTITFSVFPKKLNGFYSNLFLVGIKVFSWCSCWN